MIVHVVQQVAVFYQPTAVSDAVSTTVVQSLSYRLWSVSLSRVNSAINVIGPHQLERLQVSLRGVVFLGTGEVKANHSAALVRHRQLCHLKRTLGRYIADTAQDDVGHDAVGFAGLT